MRIHAFIERSIANGPGERFTVWFQGCAERCQDCCNPDLIPLDGGADISVDYLGRKILGTEGIEGLSVSGGEPLLQLDGLVALLQTVRRAGLSTLVFTGYTYEELQLDEKFLPLLQYSDVLVAGPYQKELHRGTCLIASTNQQIVLLSERYSMEDFDHIPEAEIHIGPEGEVRLSGIDPGAIFLGQRTGKSSDS